MIAFIVIASLILAAALLFYFFIGPFERSEPKIMTLKEPIKMIGVSMRTGLKTIFKDAANLGRRYKQVKDQDLISNKKVPWGFVAISKDFQGSESWDYLMGDVVTTLDRVPAGLESFQIPAITYAVFPVRPKSKFAWGITIGRTKKHIYTEWLPNSTYEADNSLIGDFEYHDERSLQKKPEIDLYVAIKEKGIDTSHTLSEAQ